MSQPLRVCIVGSGNWYEWAASAVL